jgi:DNA-binding NarL/FixJ family response regulator
MSTTRRATGARLVTPDVEADLEARTQEPSGDSSAARPASVLVADDHPIIRDFLTRQIGADGRLALAAEAVDGREALRLAEQLRPDAMVLDIEMPGLDGAGVMRGLDDAGLGVRVLILTGHSRPRALAEVRSLRPDAILFKAEVAARSICDEIVAVTEGVRVRRDAPYSLPDSRFDLDDTEKVVLRLAAEQRPVAELACRLNVSPSTAKEYRHDLRMKFGAKTTIGVVAIAMRLGLLD